MRGTAFQSYPHLTKRNCSTPIFRGEAGADGKKATPRIHPVKKFKSIRDAQIYSISSLPGIGAERASSILEHYRTPAKALDNIDSWPDEIDGIGLKTAEKARKILRSAFECEKAS